MNKSFIIESGWFACSIADPSDDTETTTSSSMKSISRAWKCPIPSDGIGLCGGLFSMSNAFPSLAAMQQRHKNHLMVLKRFSRSIFRLASIWRMFHWTDRRYPSHVHTKATKPCAAGDEKSNASINSFIIHFAERRGLATQSVVVIV